MLIKSKERKQVLSCWVLSWNRVKFHRKVATKLLLSKSNSSTNTASRDIFPLSTQIHFFPKVTSYCYFLQPLVISNLVLQTLVISWSSSIIFLAVLLQRRRSLTLHYYLTLSTPLYLSFQTLFEVKLQKKTKEHMVRNRTK